MEVLLHFRTFTSISEIFYHFWKFALILEVLHYFWKFCILFWKFCINFGSFASFSEILLQLWNFCFNFGRFASILEVLLHFWKSCINFESSASFLEFVRILRTSFIFKTQKAISSSFIDSKLLKIIINTPPAIHFYTAYLTCLRSCFDLHSPTDNCKIIFNAHKMRRKFLYIFFILFYSLLQHKMLRKDKTWKCEWETFLEYFHINYYYYRNSNEESISTESL